ncbi:hypothetical protein T12_829 [Trichinella patagoniensis]|uniref:Uncharacterized protein n=1 Tax=Trichinella patagoniensis TaxID=990121 RepID=A0A0V0ZF15_9BILA|nr:hypothetical protein T12_829 [Trichinella patagoniensis]
MKKKPQNSGQTIRTLPHQQLEQFEQSYNLIISYGGLSEIVYPPRSWSASSIWATIVYQVPDNECLPRGRVTGSEELKPPNRHGQKHKMKTAQHCPQKHLAHQQWSPYAVNESDPRFETKPTINWHTVFPCLAKTSKAKAGGRVAQDMNSSLAASSASLPAVDISNVKKCTPTKFRHSLGQSPNSSQADIRFRQQTESKNTELTHSRKVNRHRLLLILFDHAASVAGRS